jgi:hypothetical protein
VRRPVACSGKSRLHRRHARPSLLGRFDGMLVKTTRHARRDAPSHLGRSLVVPVMASLPTRVDAPGSAITRTCHAGKVGLQSWAGLPSHVGKSRCMRVQASLDDDGVRTARLDWPTCTRWKVDLPRLAGRASLECTSIFTRVKPGVRVREGRADIVRSRLVTSVQSSLPGW